jgi:hypothetical protein
MHVTGNPITADHATYVSFIPRLRVRRDCCPTTENELGQSIYGIRHGPLLSFPVEWSVRPSIRGREKGRERRVG